MTLDLKFGRRLYDWWGGHAELYGVSAWIVFMGREAALRRRAVESIGIREGETVMDLCCGTGVNFSLLQNKVGSAGRIVAFDYSRGMLGAARERARSQGWSNIRLLQGDAGFMSVAQGCLDHAFCSLGLSAVPAHEEAIGHVHRALKPGGRFVVLDGKLFEGAASLLNPAIVSVFKYTANWNHRKDIIAVLRDIFRNVEVRKFNSGSVFIAKAVKSG